MAWVPLKARARACVAKYTQTTSIPAAQAYLLQVSVRATSLLGVCGLFVETGCGCEC